MRFGPKTRLLATAAMLWVARGSFAQITPGGYDSGDPRGPNAAAPATQDFDSANQRYNDTRTKFDALEKQFEASQAKVDALHQAAFEQFLKNPDFFNADQRVFDSQNYLDLLPPEDVAPELTDLARHDLDSAIAAREAMIDRFERSFAQRPDVQPALVTLAADRNARDAAMKDLNDASTVLDAAMKLNPPLAEVVPPPPQVYQYDEPMVGYQPLYLPGPYYCYDSAIVAHELRVQAFIAEQRQRDLDRMEFERDARARVFVTRPDSHHDDHDDRSDLQRDRLNQFKQDRAQQTQKAPQRAAVEQQPVVKRPTPRATPNNQSNDRQQSTDRGTRYSGSSNSSGGSGGGRRR